MDGRIYGLDLFSGIGGNTIGLRHWVKTVAYCEHDRHAQSVLLSRMADGNLERAPIWSNVTTLRGESFDVPIDIIISGFPCQDISVAGKGAGLEGQRSGLFFEIVRLAQEIKPTFLFLENVPAIRTRGLDRVITELAAIGYDMRWTMLSAREVGAPHKRNRWFMLAYSERNFLWHQQRGSGGAHWQIPAKPRDDGALQSLAHTNSFQLHGTGWRPFKNRRRQLTNCRGWKTEPDVGRVVDGLPFRVDRLKRLGNAVVPAQARKAFELLSGLDQIGIGDGVGKRWAGPASIRR